MGLYLTVWTRKPWWKFWLSGRWEELEMHPPPGTSDEEVGRLADEIRATGAGCRINQVAA